MPAAEIGGREDFEFRINSNSLWSVNSVNRLPNKYLWNFLTPNTIPKPMHLSQSGYSSFQPYSMNGIQMLSPSSETCDRTAPKP